MGEDAPGLRVSMSNGSHVLTFMSFLDGPVINFRGGHIHKLMLALKQRGFVAEEYNTEPEVQLMRDEKGSPLPANECGHFSVSDPDGREILFNTHPFERQPFEDALRGLPRQDGLDSHPARRGFQQLQIRFDTEKLDDNRQFYAMLGLTILRSSQSGKRLTMGYESCPPVATDLGFALQLQQAALKATSLIFQYRDAQALAATLQAESLHLREHEGDWIGMDPDGRPLIFRESL